MEMIILPTNRDAREQERDREARSPDTNYERLCLLARTYPEAIDENPILDLLSLEDPALYQKLWHRRNLAWIGYFRDLPEEDREAVALGTLDRTYEYWMQRLTAQQDRWFSGEPCAQVFAKGVKARREWVSGRISAHEWSALVAHYHGPEANKTCSVTIPIARAHAIVRLAICFSTPEELRNDVFLWQVEEIRTRWLAKEG